ncbi:MAG: cyclic nucleotide-binding domain-containing protein [Kofleriaceae bacterium]
MNRAGYRLGVVMVSLAMTAAVLLRSFADGAFLEAFGAAWLPHLVIAHAGALAMLTLGYDALSRRRAAAAALDRALPLTLLAVAALAPVAVREGGAALVVTVLATTAVSAVTQLALWNSLALSLAGRDARRGLPRAGAAVTAGAMVAGLGARPLIGAAGLTALPALAAMLALAVTVVFAAQRRALARGGMPGAGPAGRGRRATAGAHRRPPPHRDLARGGRGARAIVGSLVEVAFGAGLKASLAAAEADHRPRLVLRGHLGGAAGAAGARGAAPAGHPVAVVHGVEPPGAAHPRPRRLRPGAEALVTVALLRSGDSLLRAATCLAPPRPGAHAVGAAPGDRARWKVLLRGGATPVGAALAGTVMVVTGSSPWSHPHAFAAVGAAVAAVWLVAVRRSAGAFVSALARPLGVAAGAASGRRVAAGADLDERRQLVLACGDDDRATAALARARLRRDGVAPAELVGLLDHDRAEVRRALYRLVAGADAADVERELAVAVTIEDDDEALAAGVGALARLGSDAGLERGRSRAPLSTEVAAAVAGCELHLKRRDDGASLTRLLVAEPAWAAAMWRARRGPDDAWALAFTRGFADPRTRAHAAAAALGAGAVTPAAASALDAVLRALVDGDDACRAAVTTLDDGAVAALSDAVVAHRPGAPARRALAAATAGVGVAAPLAWTLADADDARVRDVALASLGAMGAPAGDAARAARAITRALGDLARADGDDADARVTRRRALRRALAAAALESVAAGRPGAPLRAAARHLSEDAGPAARRALDVVQEVARHRPALLDAIERYLGRGPVVGTSTAPTSVRAHLRATALFAELDPADLDQLERAACVREVGPGESITGDDELRMIVDGTARAGEIELGPGDAVDLVGAVHRQRHPATAVAGERGARVVAVTTPAFHAVLADPAVGLALARMLARLPARAHHG